VTGRAMKYLFGPVNSRRLGVSLGVDLVPYKTCSLNCVYCECGDTTDLTSAVAEYVPTDEVIAELDGYCAASPRLDVITFSGSGEPTLHSGIGRIIDHIKDRYPRYRVAVLTNGTMLRDPAVRRSIARADIVVPSLDAAIQWTFDAICRPVEDTSVEAVIVGIASFRRSFPGLMLLEIFIVLGVNDNPEELEALRKAALYIAPDAVQLNHLDRPAAASELVSDTDANQLEAIRDYLAPLKVQIVRSRLPGEAAPWDSSAIFREVLAAFGPEPTSLHRLSISTGIREGELAKILARMSEQGLVHLDASSGQIRPLSPKS